MPLSVLTTGKKPDTFNHELHIDSPVSGQIVALESLPDLAIQQGMWGEGVALRTRATRMLSPCDGVIEQLDIDGLRWVLKANNGLRLMLQLGPVYTPLFGERLQLNKHQGNRIRKGELLTLFDPLFLQQKNGHCFCVLTVLNRKGISALVPASIGERLTTENTALTIYL